MKQALSTTQINTNKLFLHGSGLGASVVLEWLSSDSFASDKILGVIIENAYTSIWDLAEYNFPFLKHVKRLNMSISGSNLDFLRSVKNPILFIAGENDTVVPSTHTQLLFDNAKGTEHKEKYIIQGAGHNNLWDVGGKEYIYAIKDFMERALDIGFRKNTTIPQNNAPAQSEANSASRFSKR